MDGSVSGKTPSSRAYSRSPAGTRSSSRACIVFGAWSRVTGSFVDLVFLQTTFSPSFSMMIFFLTFTQ